jgi:hypothetical protein
MEPLMNTPSIPVEHEIGIPLAALEAGANVRIDKSPVGRWLHVRHGRVWLTRTLARGQATDLWLSAGECCALPAGSEWLLEADRAAAVQLLQAWPAAHRAATESIGARWLSALRTWWPGRALVGD